MSNDPELEIFQAPPVTAPFGLLLEEECVHGLDGPARWGSWLLPLREVACATIPIAQDDFEDLVQANKAVLSAASSDYGIETPACAAIGAAQQRLVARWLRSRGLKEGRDFVHPMHEGVLGAATCGFHIDRDFGDPGVLFAVTSILGEGDLVFPNMGFARSFTRGSFFLFDPLEVHGLCQKGARHAGDVPFLVVTSQVILTFDGCARLGLIRRTSDRGLPEPRNLRTHDVRPTTGEQCPW